METRRDFFNYLITALSAFAVATIGAGCGSKPDVVTEPSPEWPPVE